MLKRKRVKLKINFIIKFKQLLNLTIAKDELVSLAFTSIINIVLILNQSKKGRTPSLQSILIKFK